MLCVPSWGRTRLWPCPCCGGWHQPTAGGTAAPGLAWLSPGAAPAAGMQEGISSLEIVSEIVSAPGDLQGFGTSPASGPPMDLSWATAMSTPGLFWQTEVTCWRNMNRLLCTSEKNFNITPFLFFREVQTVCPQISGARLCSVKDFCQLLLRKMPWVEISGYLFYLNYWKSHPANCWLSLD